MGISTEPLHQPVEGLGRKRMAYEWLRPVPEGCFWHIGEIQALKAIKAQQKAQVAPQKKRKWV